MAWVLCNCADARFLVVECTLTDPNVLHGTTFMAVVLLEKCVAVAVLVPWKIRTHTWKVV